ncbi:MAG: hypothetical protein KDK66_06585 [Deltaproteobacteria bacterium]|nr:hypothetical protein [Deltaproteobacteria bacterium]
MEQSFQKVLSKLSNQGVVHRDQVKNDTKAVKRLLYLGYLKEVHRRGRVYLELTEKALPLLDSQRTLLLERAKLFCRLSPQSKFYQALLGDLRFLDSKHPKASKYLFLGNWDLKRPVRHNQLKLSQYRYYEQLS